MSLFRKPESQFWWTRFYINGREYRLSTKESDRRRAVTEAARIRQRALADTTHGASQSLRGLGTLKELARVDVQAAIARGTTDLNYKAIAYRWKCLLVHFGEHTSPAEITEEVVLGYINERKRAGNRGQSIRKFVANLRRGLELAEKRGWITKVPPIPEIASDEKCPKRRGKLVDSETVRTVLKEVATETALAAEFAVHTGLRFEEVARARFSYVDKAPEGSKVAAIMRLPGASTKNKRGRTIGLSVRALEIVTQQYKAHGDILFPTRHHAQALARACKRLHLPYTITMRDMRHTFASNALKASGDLSAVSKALGHSELETTALYLHSKEQDVIGLAAHMDALMGPGKPAQAKHRTRRTVRKLPKIQAKMERETGFEPATFCLGSKCKSEKINDFSTFSELSAVSSLVFESIDTGPGVGPGKSVGPGNEYDRIEVMCENCSRLAEVEVGPGSDQCVFCGNKAYPILEPLDAAEVVAEARKS